MPTIAWLGISRPESTREESAEFSSRQKCKARTAVAKGGKESTM